MSKHYTDEDLQAAIRAYWRMDTDSALSDGFMPAVLDAVAPAIAARALRGAAERTVDRAVCCDEYEQFKATGNRPKHPHHICYWGASHAEALRSDADEIEADR